jgi:hypothetical protein
MVPIRMVEPRWPDEQVAHGVAAQVLWKCGSW